VGEGFEEDWRGGGSRNVIKSWGQENRNLIYGEIG